MSSARFGGRAAGLAAGTLRRGGTAWPARPPRLRCACRRTAPQPVVPAQAGTQCGVRGGTATRCRTRGVTAGLDRGSGLRPVSWHGVTYRRDGERVALRRACSGLGGRDAAAAAERHGRLDRRGCGALAGAPRPSRRTGAGRYPVQRSWRHRDAVPHWRRDWGSTVGSGLRPVSWHGMTYRRDDDGGGLQPTRSRTSVPTAAIVASFFAASAWLSAGRRPPAAVGGAVARSPRCRWRRSCWSWSCRPPSSGQAGRRGDAGAGGAVQHPLLQLLARGADKASPSNTLAMLRTIARGEVVSLWSRCGARSIQVRCDRGGWFRRRAAVPDAVKGRRPAV